MRWLVPLIWIVVLLLEEGFILEIGVDEAINEHYDEKRTKMSPLIIDQGLWLDKVTKK